MTTPLTLARAAREAAPALAALSADVRNRALLCAAETLYARRADIFEANRSDLARAREQHLAAPLLSRLRFDEAKLRTVLDGLQALAALPDPLGCTLLATQLAPGLDLYRVSCPIGVIGVIFESRPDALVQIASLCLKSGNAALLKGGSEADATNRALFAAMQEAAVRCGVPAGALGLLHTRGGVSALLALDEYVDLIIPRGSNAFVRSIMDRSRIPVMGHAEGVCHVYVDAAADLDMAVSIAVDSKAQSVAVCNACESLLLEEGFAKAHLPAVVAALREKGVEIVACEKCRAILPDLAPATEEDYYTEYSALKISIKAVSGVDEAIAHINKYGTHHSDSIVTENAAAAEKFLEEVDSAAVYVNASTRFTDGFEFGMGAEMGISTQKLHARGPMGLRELTSYKYQVVGDGQIRG